MEYRLVTWRDDDESDRVNRLLAEGWRPQGGVTAIVEHDRDGYDYWIYVQAMVRDLLAAAPEETR